MTRLRRHARWALLPALAWLIMQGVMGVAVVALPSASPSIGERGDWPFAELVICSPGGLKRVAAADVFGDQTDDTGDEWPGNDSDPAGCQWCQAFGSVDIPETIFLAGSGWVSRGEAVLMGPGVATDVSHERMRPYLDRAGWDGLAAVKEGEVHAIYHGGARTLYDFAFLQYIAKTLHPDRFEDVDPKANLEAFFAEYMPISFDGTYITALP